MLNVFVSWLVQYVSSINKYCAKYLLPWYNPANIYLFQVNKETLEKGVKYVYDKLTIKTLELCQWYCSAVFIVNFEAISPISLVLYCYFEQVQ